MSNVVNLNQFRKKKAKDSAKKQAEENRVKHGRTKAERQAAKKERERAAKDLDGKKREKDETNDDQ